MPVWIHRWPFTPLHVAEVVSAVALREILGVQDGGLLHLDIDERDLDPLPLIARDALPVLWRFRNDWYYRGYRYRRNGGIVRAQRLCGAYQWP